MMVMIMKMMMDMKMKMVEKNRRSVLAENQELFPVFHVNLKRQQEDDDDDDDDYEGDDGYEDEDEHEDGDEDDEDEDEDEDDDTWPAAPASAVPSAFRTDDDSVAAPAPSAAWGNTGAAGSSRA